MVRSQNEKGLFFKLESFGKTLFTELYTTALRLPF